MKVTKVTETERRTEAMAMKAQEDARNAAEPKEKNAKINKLIREGFDGLQGYSASEELSILRHTFMALVNGTEVPAEFATFCQFVEAAKAKANEK